jgi:hypothetical protein
MKVLMIEGVIRPLVSTSSCGASAYSAQSPAELLESTYDIPDVVLGSIAENLDNDPNFWKNRTVAHMLASPHVISISFIPSDGSECEILFVQKKDLAKKITGFVTHCFNECDQRKCGAMNERPLVYHTISNEEDIDRSLRGIANHINESELKPLLRHFLADSMTYCLAVTFQDDNKHVLTRGWVKQSLGDV